MQPSNTTFKIKKPYCPKWYTPRIIHFINQIKSLRKPSSSKYSPSPFVSDKLIAIKLNLLDEMAKAKEAYQLLLFATPPGLFSCIFSNMLFAGTIPSTVH